MNSTAKKIDLERTEGFFDHWHFNEIDDFAPFSPERAAEKIAEKIRLKQVWKEFPQHFAQLLLLS